MTLPRRIWLVYPPLALALGGAAVAFVFTSNHETSPALTAAVGLVVGWSFVGSGLIAWARRPENATGRLMVAVGLTFFLSAFSESNDSLVFTLAIVFSNVFIAVVVHLLLAYPSGRLTGRAERAIVATTYPVALLASTTSLLAVKHLSGCKGCPASAFALTDSRGLEHGLNVFWDAVGVVIVGAAVVLLVRRWRSATPAYRRAVTPVIAAGGLMLTLLGLTFALEAVSRTAQQIVSLAAVVAFFAVPVAFLIGLLRSRLTRAGAGRLLAEFPEEPTLEQVEAALRRELHDPTLALAYCIEEPGGYVDVQGRPLQVPLEAERLTFVEVDGKRIGALVHDAALRDEPALVEEVVAAAALTLEKARLQAELRARVEELRQERDFLGAVANATPSMLCVVDADGRVANVGVNRTFGVTTGYGDTYARERLLGELVMPEEPETLRRAIGDVSAGAPVRERETVWRTRDGEPRIVAWSCTALPGGELFLVAGADVTQRKRQEEEVRASRARIVEAGDAERRRLERNLHDGAQQRLVSLSLGLRLTRTKVSSDAAAAEKMLDAAATELSQALEELRELARGIHPAVLSDRGLGPALESLAQRATVPVELVSVPGERLPAAVEAAAFFVVSEALANVAKYADATSVRVRVCCENGAALVEVEDDGVGGADPGRGSGLRGLADRVAALDGTIRVESPPGRGTRVAAEIPCA